MDDILEFFSDKPNSYKNSERALTIGASVVFCCRQVLILTLTLYS